MINALTTILGLNTRSSTIRESRIETQNTSSSSATTSYKKRKVDASEGCIKQERSGVFHSELPPEKESVWSKEMEKTTTQSKKSIASISRIKKLTWEMRTSKKMVFFQKIYLA